MRRASVLLAAALLVLAGAAPARAAEAPRLVVQQSDPLMTDPVRVEVAAIDASGDPVAFTGTAVLRTSGRRAVTATMSGGAGGVAEVALATASLQPGPATLVLRARVAGRAVVRTLTAFTEVPASLTLRGFGCAAVGPAGGALRWAVDSMAGDPVRTPNSRDVPLLPYVASSAPLGSMSGADGLPLATSGRVVITSGTAVVARVTLPRQVRRLVFGSRWNGRVRGAFRPGAYTATLTLRDAAGRTTTAVQTVTAVRGAGPCTA